MEQAGYLPSTKETIYKFRLIKLKKYPNKPRAYRHSVLIFRNSTHHFFLFYILLLCNNGLANAREFRRPKMNEGLLGITIAGG